MQNVLTWCPQKRSNLCHFPSAKDEVSEGCRRRGPVPRSSNTWGWPFLSSKLSTSSWTIGRCTTHAHTLTYIYLQLWMQTSTRLYSFKKGGRWYFIFTIQQKTSLILVKKWFNIKFHNEKRSYFESEIFSVLLFIIFNSEIITVDFVLYKFFEIIIHSAFQET